MSGLISRYPETVPIPTVRDNIDPVPNGIHPEIFGSGQGRPIPSHPETVPSVRVPSRFFESTVLNAVEEGFTLFIKLRVLIGLAHAFLANATAQLQLFCLLHYANCCK